MFTKSDSAIGKPLESLGLDIIKSIASFLNQRELLPLSQVSKFWLQTARTESNRQKQIYLIDINHIKIITKLESSIDWLSKQNLTHDTLEIAMDCALENTTYYDAITLELKNESDILLLKYELHKRTLKINYDYLKSYNQNILNQLYQSIHNFFANVSGLKIKEIKITNLPENLQKVITANNTIKLKEFTSFESLDKAYSYIGYYRYIYNTSHKIHALLCRFLYNNRFKSTNTQFVLIKENYHNFILEVSKPISQKQVLQMTLEFLNSLKVLMTEFYKKTKPVASYLFNNKELLEIDSIEDGLKQQNSCSQKNHL